MVKFGLIFNFLCRSYSPSWLSFHFLSQGHVILSVHMTQCSDSRLGSWNCCFSHDLIFRFAIGVMWLLLFPWPDFQICDWSHVIAAFPMTWFSNLRSRSYYVCFFLDSIFNFSPQGHFCWGFGTKFLPIFPASGSCRNTEKFSHLPTLQNLKRMSLCMDIIADIWSYYQIFCEEPGNQLSSWLNSCYKLA